MGSGDLIDNVFAWANEIDAGEDPHAVAVKMRCTAAEMVEAADARVAALEAVHGQ